MIEVENLRKVYKVNVKKAGLKGAFENLFHTEWLVKAAVDGLSFRMKEGHALACIGENGAGKSTLIKMMIGILTPTEGEVRVFGQNPRQGGRKYPREIGVVFGFLLFIVLYAFICVIPVEILRGTCTRIWCLAPVAVNIGFFLLARAVFYKGIRHYESMGISVRRTSRAHTAKAWFLGSAVSPSQHS